MPRQRQESRESIDFRHVMKIEMCFEKLGWPPLDCLDTDTLVEVSKLLGVVEVEGKQFALLVPSADCTDHSRFDSTICKAGVKAFARPHLVSDGDLEQYDGDIKQYDEEFVWLIREVKPGLRARMLLARKQDPDTEDRS